jgi:hypothetical protein
VKNQGLELPVHTCTTLLLQQHTALSSSMFCMQMSKNVVCLHESCLINLNQLDSVTECTCTAHAITLMLPSSSSQHTASSEALPLTIA